MKGDRKQFVAATLMVISLFFLAGFLILFLISSYKKEKETIQKEVGYLFVNSIRQIEGGILNKLVIQIDSPRNNQIHFPVQIKDSINIKSIIRVANDNVEMKERKLEWKSTNYNIDVNNNGQLNNLNQVEGSVAMFIALCNDSTGRNDSCKTGTMDNAFLQELKRNFRKNIESANLSLDYYIFKESIIGKRKKEDLLLGSYTDVSSGDRYVVSIEHYDLLIFRNIIPEFVFSFLLFICVALAFYLVYKSLAAEKMLLNLKNNFIQNITHELKTPIATVSVAIEALQDFNIQEDECKRNEYLAISKTELKRLSLLVDKVLNVSQIENELPAIQTEVLNLEHVIQEILDTLKLQFKKQNGEVKFECNDVGLFISGDRQRVDGILYNLLDNAIKYNFSNPPIIDLQLCRVENQIQLIIKDNGIGIPKDHQKRVFEKFYRVPQGNIHNVKGHGLGLSFVAQVVAEMGGEITLESQQSVGSTFIILFPINLNL